jgi:hypothetical protein
VHQTLNKGPAPLELGPFIHITVHSFTCTGSLHENVYTNKVLVTATNRRGCHKSAVQHFLKLQRLSENCRTIWDRCKLGSYLVLTSHIPNSEADVLVLHSLHIETWQQPL